MANMFIAQNAMITVRCQSCLTEMRTLLSNSDLGGLVACFGHDGKEQFRLAKQEPGLRKRRPRNGVPVRQVAHPLHIGHLNLEGLATMVVAWVVFRENVDRRLVLGAASILAGAVLLTWKGSAIRFDPGVVLYLRRALHGAWTPTSPASCRQRTRFKSRW